jgi:hypothetical protein
MKPATGGGIAGSYTQVISSAKRRPGLKLMDRLHRAGLRPSTAVTWLAQSVPVDVLLLPGPKLSGYHPPSTARWIQPR